MHDYENRKEARLILISEEMFSDVPHLQRQLAELYLLGNELEYQLDFDLFYLSILNRIFDEIILRYGLRNVFFRFPEHCDFDRFKKALALKGSK